MFIKHGLVMAVKHSEYSQNIERMSDVSTGLDDVGESHEFAQSAHNTPKAPTMRLKRPVCAHSVHSAHTASSMRP